MRLFDNTQHYNILFQLHCKIHHVLIIIVCTFGTSTQNWVSNEFVHFSSNPIVFYNIFLRNETFDHYYLYDTERLSVLLRVSLFSYTYFPRGLLWYIMRVSRLSVGNILMSDHFKSFRLKEWWFFPYVFGEIKKKANILELQILLFFIIIHFDQMCILNNNNLI